MAFSLNLENIVNFCKSIRLDLAPLFYHPQANPVERINRAIKTMLISFASDNHRDWDLFLPKISCAIHTAKHEVIGQAPFFVNFGTLPVNAILVLLRMAMMSLKRAREILKILCVYRLILRVSTVIFVFVYREPMKNLNPFTISDIVLFSFCRINWCAVRILFCLMPLNFTLLSWPTSLEVPLWYIVEYRTIRMHLRNVTVGTVLSGTWSVEHLKEQQGDDW